MTHELDNLIASKTGFTSFDDLVTAGGNYTPTININADPELRPIAEAYDTYQASVGSLKRAYVIYPKREQHRRNKIQTAIIRQENRILRERRITAAELKTLNNAHRAALRENYFREWGHEYRPGDDFSIYSNQAMRDGYVIAIEQGKILIEYEMPAGTSSLVEISVDSDLRLSGENRTHSYNAVPKHWLAAIRDAGTTDWIGMGQRSTVRIPFPTGETK